MEAARYDRMLIKQSNKRYRRALLYSLMWAKKNGKEIAGSITSTPALPDQFCVQYMNYKVQSTLTWILGGICFQIPFSLAQALPVRIGLLNWKRCGHSKLNHTIYA